MLCGWVGTHASYRVKRASYWVNEVRMPHEATTLYFISVHQSQGAGERVCMGVYILNAKMCDLKSSENVWLSLTPCEIHMPILQTIWKIGIKNYKQQNTFCAQIALIDGRPFRLIGQSV